MGKVSNTTVGSLYWWMTIFGKDNLPPHMQKVYKEYKEYYCDKSDLRMNYTLEEALLMSMIFNGV